MRVVASYLSPDEAYLAASVLEGSGLSPRIRDGNTVAVDWFYSQAIGGVKLEVPEDEYEQAVELLGLPPASEPSMLCPHCGSSEVRLRELSILNALSILLVRIALPRKSRRADCMACRKSFKVGPDADGRPSRGS